LTPVNGDYGPGKQPNASGGFVCLENTLQH
jgi:hypothetical protein